MKTTLKLTSLIVAAILSSAAIASSEVTVSGNLLNTSILENNAGLSGFGLTATYKPSKFSPHSFAAKVESSERDYSAMYSSVEEKYKNTELMYSYELLSTVTSDKQSFKLVTGLQNVSDKVIYGKIDGSSSYFSREADITTANVGIDTAIKVGNKITLGFSSGLGFPVTGSYNIDTDGKVTDYKSDYKLVKFGFKAEYDLARNQKVGLYLEKESKKVGKTTSIGLKSFDSDLVRDKYGLGYVMSF